jgi:ribose transport system substrate-binding protein
MSRCAVLLAMVVGLAAGCDQGDRSATAKKILWYSPTVHPFPQEVKKGVEAFEKDSGVTVQKSFGQEFSQDNENVNIEAFAAKGFDGFVIQPCDVSAANSLYEELTGIGKVVVGYGTSTIEPTTASFAIATDVKRAAMEATEALIRLMGGKGNIVNVLEMVEDPSTILRDQGIEEVVAKYPDVKIIQTIAGMDSIETSTTKIEDVLATKIEQIDGIVTTGYTPTVAAATILAEWHAMGNKRGRFVGIDTDEVVLKAIRDGRIDATLAQNPRAMGYVGCSLVSHLLDGWTARAGYQTIDSGTVLITKDNVDTFEKEVAAVTEKIKKQIETKYLAPPKT